MKTIKNNKFYCEDESKKENMELFKLIKKHMKDLDFEYNKSQNLIYSATDVRCVNHKAAFHIKIAIRKDKLMVSFYFDTYFNNETTYYVNFFNSVANPTYKAYIDGNGRYEYYLAIDHFVTIGNVNDAFDEFKRALNYVNSGRLIGSIEVIYKIYNPDSTNIKEMN